MSAGAASQEINWRDAYRAGQPLHSLVMPEGFVFEDTNLAGARMQGLRAPASRWLRCVLAGAVLDGAWLPNAIMAGSILAGASLRGAWLKGADLRGCDLTGADLSGTNLDDVLFDESTLWPEETTSYDLSVQNFLR